MKKNDSALSHLRVLDLSRVLAGPWSTQILADLGAEVIKVERPNSGDDTRHWGPPYLQDKAGHHTNEAAYYLSANRGKQSIAIDISRAEGQALIRQLVSNCDILIENYKVGTLARYQLSYDDLAPINPKLIYCSITGFGQTGPLSHLPGYDFIIQGMGGLMSVTGESDNLPGGGPQKLGIAFADLMTGMYTTVAILAALAHRNNSGEGQYIDMALLDVQIASLANMNLNYLISGNIPKRQGNAHPNIVPYQVFQAKDSTFIVAAGNDNQFQKLCQVLEQPELSQDARYATNAGRVEHREQLSAYLDKHFRQHLAAHWIEKLQAVDIPCGPINNIAQALNNPQVKHRGMSFELPHPQAACVPQIASPFHFSKTPVRYHQAPPLLGEHSDSVLKKILHLNDNEIHLLRQKGIIQ